MNALNAVVTVSHVQEEQTTALLMEDVDLVYSSTMVLFNVLLSALMVYMEIPTLVSANYVQLVVKCVSVLLCKSVLSVESILITPLKSITNIL
jgi:hypothetical protein